jgi:hypothetical protein
MLKNTSVESHYNRRNRKGKPKDKKAKIKQGRTKYGPKVKT